MVEYILTMTASVGGTTVPTLGTHPFVAGSQVLGITPYPDPGYTFSHWVKDGVDAGDLVPFSLVMDADHILHAVFMGAPLEHVLTIEAPAHGTTEPTPGTYAYVEGSTAAVIAFPEAGYYFNHYLLNGETRTENPISILMDRPYILLAVFTETPPPPEEVNLVMMGGVAVAVADAALVAIYLLKHFKVID